MTEEVAFSGQECLKLFQARHTLSLECLEMSLAGKTSDLVVFENAIVLPPTSASSSSIVCWDEESQANWT